MVVPPNRGEALEEDRNSPIAVLGAGSWGTALALALAAGERSVTLWARDPAHVEAMSKQRGNERYLPDIPLPRNISVTSNLSVAVAASTDVLVAVPSHAFRGMLVRLSGVLRGPTRLAWATKGFDPGTGKLLHDVVAEELPGVRARAVLSGPTFAAEIARGLPAAITVAADTVAHAQAWSRALSGERLRVYRSDDLTGVAVGGAVKNALAIAAGVSDALGFGANARAALISRGVHEMSRLGIALGGKRETLIGLAGLGDLVLTCTDNQSRNRRFGLAIGAGQSAKEAATSIGQVVEGISSAREVVRLARTCGIEMPICEQVLRVLDGELTAHSAVSNLFARQVGLESEL